MNLAKQVIVTPATVNRMIPNLSMTSDKKKVAAYARVSTDELEQISSYEAQVEYYTNYIKQNASWEFVDIYTDEGISATNTKKRDGFRQMIKDALDGKIDLILTKSVSRFARNTVDSLITVRKLKEKGVEVFFEKENIHTLDSKGELLITIMSSLAQEESRSISENVTWGIRKSFSDGKINLPYKHFLGYEKGEDGSPKIVPEEAETVRLIYSLFLKGKTTAAIAKILTEKQVLNPSKTSARWHTHTVSSILQNEKYKGEAILQKTLTVDFLNKIRKKNQGEVPMYHVQNSHPAIIEPETFDLVQEEFKKRRKYGYTSGNSFLSNKLICGDCGNFYGSKVWSSNSKYKKTIWRCNNKYQGNNKCKTPHIYEGEIKKAFIKAANNLISNKDEIIENCKHTISEYLDIEKLEENAEKLKVKSEEIYIKVQDLIQQNARENTDQNYDKEYSMLIVAFDDTNSKLEEVKKRISKRKTTAYKIKNMLDALKEQEHLITEFDEELWFALIEEVVVNKDKNLIFIFKNEKTL